MTPEEKAISIVHQMYSSLFHTNAEPAHVKQCALIAVDEIFFALKYNLDAATSGSVKYWNKVKQEIQNL